MIKKTIVIVEVTNGFQLTIHRDGHDEEYIFNDYYRMGKFIEEVFGEIKNASPYEPIEVDPSSQPPALCDPLTDADLVEDF